MTFLTGPGPCGGRRRMAGAIPAFFAIWAAVLGGCGSSRSAAPEPALQPIRFEQWQRELASLRGRIIVVDVWATWCAPCLERFPHMVQLYQQYKDRGVVFVSLSVDDHEDKQAVETARRFLKKQNAVFRNYLMDENILQSFEKLGVQGIPAVFLYDRDGRLRYNLNGNDPNHQFTSRDVEDALAALAAEP
jgi:thiol-disulfide isomerase/thioredoxin